MFNKDKKNTTEDDSKLAKDEQGPQGVMGSGRVMGGNITDKPNADKQGPPAMAMGGNVSDYAGAPEQDNHPEAFMPIDRKYTGRIFKADGSEIELHDWVAFRAQDKALLPTLKGYRKSCIKLGSPQEHIDGINQLIARVRAYQDQYPSKVPD